MSKVSNKFITMCYENSACPDMKEFVFSCKGRPFAMLSSQHRIPVPTLTLIDFNLVQDLGMKMFEIQCSKFTFAGSNLRILGKINQTVQCVKNGKLTGNLHIKANVVEDLKKTFETHSIAGTKMAKILLAEAGNSQDVEKLPSSPPPSRSGMPSTRTPSLDSSRSSPSSPTDSTPSGLSSPPGFPSVPQYSPTPRVQAVRHEPSVAVNKPPPGYVRKLQLKPDKNRYRSWHQGRVVGLIQHTTGLRLAEVDVLREDGDPLKGPDDLIYSEYCQYPGIHVDVNDVVLYRDYDRTPGLSWDEMRSRILVVYNDEEVDLLSSHGVKIPECPPERLPGGYYG